MPKQFHSVVGNKTLLAQTCERYQGLHQVVLTGMGWRDLAAREAGPQADVLCEPMRKGTLGALCFALHSGQYQLDDTVFVVPSDGMFNSENFPLGEAQRFTQQGNLVIFGARPTCPETGYGYIKMGAHNHVDRFVEKPNATLAEHYLSTGKYLWNTGMLMFRVGDFIEELGNYAPEHAAYLKGEIAFEELPSISVDVGILEKSHRVAYLPFEGSWRDIGTWEGVYVSHDKDAMGNVIIGDVQVQNVTDSLIVNVGEPMQVQDLDGMCLIKGPGGVLERELNRDVVSISAQSPQ